MAVPRYILLPIIILFSGACWYLSFDLSLHWWWPIWIAPAPVLYIATRVKAGQAFAVAFLSFLIGRLSWLGYLLAVLPKPMAWGYTLFYPLVFALLLLPVRKIMRTAPPAIALSIFPVLWTSFEFLQFLWSPDGTIGSIAHTQSDFLLVMQLASITGAAGITFLLCLVPSAIALAARDRFSGRNTRYTLGGVAALVLLIMLYGSVRLSSHPEKTRELTIGLTALDKNETRNSTDPHSEEELRLTHLYLLEIERLANQGARIILIPEKAIPVTDSTENMINGLFMETARRHAVTIIGNYTRIRKEQLENQAWAISPDGKFLANYLKVNLFEGERMEGFISGKEAAVFSSGDVISGVAICKDLDFEQYMRTYRQKGATILYVPAWDFVRDGWLHSRIAMMRAIENGYSLVRNAREGRLTLSDDRGRITAETSNEQTANSLIGKISPSASVTLYSRWGDWFAWLVLVAAAYLLLFRTSHNNPSTV